jgi:hypothetical protein
MNDLTLFNAYVQVRDEMESASSNRGSSFGILANKDEFALKYQRLNRLAGKIEARFNGEWVCYSCSGLDDWHYSFCRRPV